MEAIDIIFKHFGTFSGKRLWSVCSVGDATLGKEEYLFSVLQFSQW